MTTSSTALPPSILAEWIIEKDRNPIETTVFAAVGTAQKLVGLPFDLTKLVVDYLECYPCFGEREWINLCGRVAPAPLLPHDFSCIWNGPCPVFLGEKRVKDTHMLVYLPKEVDGKPLSITSFEEIAKRYFPANKDGYGEIWKDILAALGNKTPIEKSCWMLMTKDVLPQSRGKFYYDQKAMVADLAKKALALYEVPRTLEAAICILAQYFNSHASSKIRLFSDNPATYTRCQEEVNVRRYGVVVGGFALKGLCITLDDSSCSNDFGVAALRKL